MYDYYKKIADYQPKNTQEEVDKKAILAFIERNSDVLDRDNLVAHLTSSAIVVNTSMDKVLFAHHNIYDAWGWVGGHNDGDGDLLAVAIKEAKEETGLKNIEVMDEDVFMLDIIHVSNHQKHGKYVGDHLHLNVTFLLQADEEETVAHKPDENSGVRWFAIETCLEHVDEKRMHSIYQKAFDAIEKRRNRM